MITTPLRDDMGLCGMFIAGLLGFMYRGIHMLALLDEVPVVLYWTLGLANLLGGLTRRHCRVVVASLRVTKAPSPLKLESQAVL